MSASYPRERSASYCLLPSPAIKTHTYTSPGTAAVCRCRISEKDDTRNLKFVGIGRRGYWCLCLLPTSNRSLLASILISRLQVSFLHMQNISSATPSSTSSIPPAFFSL